ncbi:MAG TPA: efflux RND transporter periplasmic adaptor subunit [Fontimonas sp.]
MNKTYAIAVSAVVLGAGAAGWWFAQSGAPHRHELTRATDEQGKPYWFCPMHPQVRQDHPGNCPICGMPLAMRTDAPAETAERKPLYWYDPMHPEQHFDQPGRSPFMDMDLVPRYADAPGAAAGDTPGQAAVVTVAPAMVQKLGMRSVAVKTGQIWQRVDTVGSVAVDENRIVTVEARAAGWLERLEVRAVGDTVRRGQVLAGLYSPELLAAQEELALARKLGDARLIDAARTRLKLLGAPDAGAQGPRRQVEVVAPQSGVVVELPVRQGAQLTPGMPLMTLADLSTVWIMVEVPEAQAAWVAPGRPAEARLRSLPGRLFEGQVDHVYPLLDAQTRTLRARIAVDNADGMLKPGMYADVTVFGGSRREVVLVPSEALIRTGTRSVVMVDEGEGRYRPVEVVAGAERNDEIEIVDGLQPGQRVVVSGQFLIDSEASLQGAYNRIGASAGDAR